MIKLSEPGYPILIFFHWLDYREWIYLLARDVWGDKTLHEGLTHFHNFLISETPSLTAAIRICIYDFLMSMPKSDSDVVLMQPGQGSEREGRKEMGLWETHLVRSQEINFSLSELTWHIASQSSAQEQDQWNIKDRCVQCQHSIRFDGFKKRNSWHKISIWGQQQVLVTHNWFDSWITAASWTVLKMSNVTTFWFYSASLLSLVLGLNDSLVTGNPGH